MRSFSLTLMMLVAACGSKAPEAVDAAAPTTTTTAAPTAPTTTTTPATDAASPTAEDAAAPTAAEDAAAPTAAEDAAAPTAAEDTTVTAAEDTTATTAAPEDAAAATVAAEDTTAPPLPADLPVVKGMAPEIVARIVDGAPGCVGISKSGRELVTIGVGAEGKRIVRSDRQDAEMVEVASLPFTDGRALATDPLVAEWASLRLGPCQATAGSPTTVPKSVPIGIQSHDYEVEVGIAGNKPVILPARYEYGSYVVEATYWSPDHGAVYLHLTPRDDGGPPDKIYVVDGAALGDPECLPRPLAGKPITPVEPPAFNPAPPEVSCVAMTADGKQAAFKTWASDTSPDGQNDGRPNAIEWFGEGAPPDIDLTCMARGGCKAEQKAALAEAAQRLGLTGCAPAKGHINIDGREAPIMYKDTTVRLKGATGWRPIHTLRSGFDGEGHESLWKMFQRPAGGPLFLYVGNEDTGISEVVVYVVDEAAMKLCPPAPAGTLAVAEVKASSAAKDGGGYKFGAAQLADGDLTTSWQPAGDKDKAPWVELALPAEATVHAVDIANGFQRKDGTGDMFTLNARVATATLTFSDGSAEKLTFAPDAREFVTFTLPSPKATTSVKLAIEGVHDGSRWAKDVALSEIRLRGAPPSP